MTSNNDLKDIFDRTAAPLDSRRQARLLAHARQVPGVKHGPGLLRGLALVAGGLAVIAAAWLLWTHAVPQRPGPQLTAPASAIDSDVRLARADTSTEEEATPDFSSFWLPEEEPGMVSSIDLLYGPDENDDPEAWLQTYELAMADLNL